MLPLIFCDKCQVFQACQMESSVLWGIEQNQQDLLQAIETNPAYKICPGYHTLMEQVGTAIDQLKAQRFIQRA